MFVSIKGRLRATISKSAETVHLIVLRYLGDAIRCAASANLRMFARNRPLVSMSVIKFEGDRKVVGNTLMSLETSFFHIFWPQ